MTDLVRVSIVIPVYNEEGILHSAVVDIIRRGIYTHIASGEKRDQATAARLKGTGVVGGFPDLMFFGIKGEVCCVELNAEGGRLSES